MHGSNTLDGSRAAAPDRDRSPEGERGLVRPHRRHGVCFHRYSRHLDGVDGGHRDATAQDFRTDTIAFAGIVSRSREYTRFRLARFVIGNATNNPTGSARFVVGTRATSSATLGDALSSAAPRSFPPGEVGALASGKDIEGDRSRCMCIDTPVIVPDGVRAVPAHGRSISKRSVLRQ